MFPRVGLNDDEREGVIHSPASAAQYRRVALFFRNSAYSPRRIYVMRYLFNSVMHHQPLPYQDRVVQSAQGVVGLLCLRVALAHKVEPLF